MKKKILSLALIAALIAIAAMGTLAYFTDEEEKINVFKFGKVDVELTEPGWNDEDDHILIPDTTIEKKPTIELADDSLDSWIILDISVDMRIVQLMWLEYQANDEYTGETDPTSLEEFMAALQNEHYFREYIIDRWTEGIDHSKWEPLDFKAENDKLTVRLGYKTVVKPTDDAIVFMQSVTMPKTVTSAMVTAVGFDGTLNLGFKVYAVQAMPVNTLAEAATVIPTL